MKPQNFEINLKINIWHKNNHATADTDTTHCVNSVQMRSFFWSVFSRIRTEYGEILRISLRSVQMQENTNQKKLRILTLFTQWLIRAICRSWNFQMRIHMHYRRLISVNWDKNCIWFAVGNPAALCYASDLKKFNCSLKSFWFDEYSWAGSS